MAKKRVHELARMLTEAGAEYSNQELVEELRALGWDVKSASSAMEEDHAQSAYEKLVAKRKAATRPTSPGFFVGLTRRRRPAEQKSHDVAATFAESEARIGRVEDGYIASGTVIQIAKDHVVVDIGYTSEGQIPLAEFIPVSGGKPQVKIGDKVEVLVVSRRNDTGMVVLSKEKADKMRIWDEISAIYAQDGTIEGTVARRERDGFFVDVGVAAFLPRSHADIRPVPDLTAFIGKTFTFKIIDFDKRKGTIVLSRRVLLEASQQSGQAAGTHDSWLEVARKYAIGERVSGRVVSICDYGVFVELAPNVEGLVHVSEMHGTTPNVHPSSLVSLGEKVSAVVIQRDLDAERISLSMKYASRPGGEVRSSVLSSTNGPVSPTERGDREPDPDLSKILTIVRRGMGEFLLPILFKVIGDGWPDRLTDASGNPLRFSRGDDDSTSLDWTALNSAVHLIRRSQDGRRHIDVAQFKLFCELKEFRDALDQHAQRPITVRELILAGRDAVALLSSIRQTQRAKQVSAVLSEWETDA